MSDKIDKDIIYLDIDEELPSVVSKIKNSKKTKIVLVVPKGALILQSIINLKLVKTNADNEKKKLSFVTQDSIGKNLLLKSGYQIDNSVGLIKGKPSKDQEEFGFDEDAPTVPVHHFQSSTISDDDNDENDQIAESEEVDENIIHNIPEEKVKDVEEFKSKQLIEEEKPRKKFNFNLKINIKKSFIAVAIVLIILVVVVIGPSATVSISVIGEPFKQTEKIEIIETENKDKLTENQLLGKIITGEAKAQEDFQTTGKVNVGEKAKATIIVYNSWSTETQAIAKGSTFTKDGLEFILLSDISVPGATLSLSEGKITTNAGKTSATIEAKEAGENYNVSSGRFVIGSISSEKQDKIYGEADKNVTGGSTQELKVISQEDYNLAVEKLEGVANEEAKKKLVEENKNLQIFVDAIKVETIDKKSSKNVGSESENFNLLVKVKATVIGVNENEYKNKFIELIKKQVPSDKSLNLRENDVIETKIESQDYDNKKINIISNISTQLSPKLDLEKIKKDIVFKSIPKAEEIIKTDQIEEVKIVIYPNFNPIKKLPIISRRIKVSIEYE